MCVCMCILLEYSNDNFTGSLLCKFANNSAVFFMWLYLMVSLGDCIAYITLSHRMLLQPYICILWSDRRRIIIVIKKKISKQIKEQSLHHNKM